MPTDTRHLLKFREDPFRVVDRIDSNKKVKFAKQMSLSYRRYSSSCALVKWDSCYSRTFILRCGVRQGGVMSPVSFAVYDNVITKLEDSNLGCYVGDT